MWHLPDGPEQQARDQFMFGKPPEGGPVWDGKNIDDPPEGPFNPLTFPYMEGYDVIDYVSVWLPYSIVGDVVVLMLLSFCVDDKTS